jgi:hypothetical protein
VNFTTGDDGDLEKGVVWPSPRFTNPDRLTTITGNVILDKLTGLIWVRNGNLMVTRDPASVERYRKLSVSDVSYVWDVRGGQ